jgi:hypothetical protein
MQGRRVGAQRTMKEDMNDSSGYAIDPAAGAGMIRQAMPTFAAAFDAVRPKRTDSADEVQIDIKTRINDADMRHLHAFSVSSKTWVMRKIRAVEPLESEVRNEDHHYEKIMLHLREEGYGLIEMLPLETALTTVWLRKKGLMPLGFTPVDVIMLEWQALGEGDATTVTIWRI